MTLRRLLKRTKADLSSLWSSAKWRILQVLRIPGWLLKAWPILSFAPIGSIHWYLFKILPNSHIMLNKFISSAFQCAGAVIFLYSINDNMGTFRNKSLLRIILEWFKDFPVKRRNTIVLGAGVGGLSLTGSAEAWVSRKGNTIEERLAELERQLEMHRELIYRKERELIDRISITKSEIQVELNKHHDRLETLSQKIELSFIGSFKLQVFAVILAIYGALVSIFA